jgi:NAD(P)-dependent dehydrogenase (short-subunit alcohol dehydrogenase family)
MGKLDGKVAVITGGSSGMGLAAAERFVAEGAYVYITARRQAPLDAAVDRIGANIVAVRSDASNLADLSRLFEDVGRNTNGIDILYANAGAAAMGSIMEGDRDHFDRNFDTNVRGTFFTVQKALPHFNDGGSIIIKGSIAGVIGRPGRSVYNASKAALRSFTRTWANELKDRRIRVNLLSPGPVDTGSLAGMTEEAKVRLGQQILRGKIGQPYEIAAAALYLASSESSFVTGAELWADGGMTQV